MSDQPPRPRPAELETPSREIEQRGVMISPTQPQRSGSPGRDGVEVVVVDDSPRLSAQQRQTAHELMRLYQSLCGETPGQYAPQSLLDVADKFSRPTFPGRSATLPVGKGR